MQTKFLAVSCLHAPITDKGYFKWLLTLLQDFNPDVFVNLGDWYEGKPAKRWPAWSDEDWTMLDEHRAVQAQAEAINSVIPDAKKVWMYGNHDDNVFGTAPDRIQEDVRTAIRWQNQRGVSEALSGWKVVDKYTHRTKFRLGPITFQHGCSVQQAAEKDGAYLYGTPFGLYVCGHTHRPVDITQCRERQVRLPYWYANPGCGADWDRMHYMDRLSMGLWGRGAIIGETAGADQHRSAFASKQWSAELVTHSMAH